MAQVEVLSVERRRRWSRSEKERIVSASFEPGVSASEVARSVGIHVSQLFRWRKQLCERVAPSTPALIPVAVVPDAPVPAEIGRRVRVPREKLAEDIVAKAVMKLNVMDRRRLPDRLRF